MQDILLLLQDPAAWIALITLVVMEVVLGIDNLVFISILTNKLPADQRERARRIGIGLALVLRLALLGKQSPPEDHDPLWGHAVQPGIAAMARLEAELAQTDAEAERLDKLEAS